MTDTLRLICIDADAPPLFGRIEDGVRRGYEPDAAALVAAATGRELEWVMRSWDQMVPALNAGEGDAIWCGQGITDSRREHVDFTRPYAVFDETVLVRADDTATAPEDLRGARVAAIAGSTNMALAETFPGIDPVAFDGGTADVFGDMIAALRAGEVDALVDDDVVTVPLGDRPEFRVAFTVPTRNAWGVSVAKDRPELRAELDRALLAVVSDGSLAAAWRHWMPAELRFPLTPSV